MEIAIATLLEVQATLDLARSTLALAPGERAWEAYLKVLDTESKLKTEMSKLNKSAANTHHETRKAA